jgi:hypothetical protein
MGRPVRRLRLGGISQGRKDQTGRAYALLDKKALQFTGRPTSSPRPADRSIYGTLVAHGAADIFLTYCTSALAVQKQNPE